MVYSIPVTLVMTGAWKVWALIPNPIMPIRVTGSVILAKYWQGLLPHEAHL
jgi:hypothetical protein